MNNIIKELKSITYDRQALEDFYHTVKHKAKPYIEVHSDLAKDSPYSRCICPKCLEKRKHKHTGDTHKHIRRLDRYKHFEIDRLSKILEPFTQIEYSNHPVLWIYEPGFELPPHKDDTREHSIIVPILPAEGGATVDIYKDDLPIVEGKVEHNEDFILNTHVYSTKHPTVLNASEVIHGVRNPTTQRVFINFSTYCKWDDLNF